MTKKNTPKKTTPKKTTPQKQSHKHAHQTERSSQTKITPQNTTIIWGRHSIEHALKNPNRKINTIYAAKDTLEWIEKQTQNSNIKHNFNIKTISKNELTEKLSKNNTQNENITHQGIAAIAEKLKQPTLEDWLSKNHNNKTLVILLDQITDARNIGAIMRSAWAFNANAIITTKKYCPNENGTMIRAACGAFEKIPLIQVANLAQTMQRLQNSGFILAGLTAQGTGKLKHLGDCERLGLILGAEGKGLRRLTQNNADILVKIPINHNAGSLNVSNAAAVALYAAQEARQNSKRPK